MVPVPIPHHVQYQLDEKRAVMKKNLVRYTAVAGAVLLTGLALGLSAYAPHQTISTLKELAASADKFASGYVSSSKETSSGVTLLMYKDKNNNGAVDAEDGDPVAVYDVVPSVMNSFNAIISGANQGASYQPAPTASNDKDTALSNIAAFIARYASSGFSIGLKDNALTAIDKNSKVVDKIAWGPSVARDDINFVLHLLGVKTVNK